jgi:hypothetical protein
MFTLRQHHQDSFQAKSEADFVHEVMDYLRENHAESAVKLQNGEFKVVDLSEEILWNMIESGIAKAGRYQITEEPDVLKFIYCFCEVLIVDFDIELNQDVLEILKNEQLNPTFKMNLIFAIRQGKLHKAKQNLLFTI